MDETSFFTVTAYVDTEPDAGDGPCAQVAMAEHLSLAEQVQLARDVAAMANAWAADAERFLLTQPS